METGRLEQYLAEVACKLLRVSESASIRRDSCATLIWRGWKSTLWADSRIRCGNGARESLLPALARRLLELRQIVADLVPWCARGDEDVIVGAAAGVVV